MARPADAASLSALGLSALGVVFGDIGTSPLYTLKTVLGLTGGDPDSVVTLGVLSLVIWTLIVVTTIKYVSIAMRVNNDGEGGILALMALLGVKRERRPVIVAVGLFGAALIYGRRYHAGNFGSLSARRTEYRDAGRSALYRSGSGRHLDRTVRGPAPGHRTYRSSVWAHHGALVPVHRRSWHLGDRAAPR